MSTGEMWTLGHRPALDGLRGIAVLLVVVSHLTQGGPVHLLGPVGVVVFFTLSGFLITSLLLEEQARTGRGVDFRRFYLRRVRRLLPAMLACVAAVAAVGSVVPGVMDWAVVVGALTYSANFVLGQGVGTESILAHMWSLAIEEQFYLVWPAVFLALAKLPRQLFAGILAAAVAAGAVVPFLLVDQGWERVYYGSDTRVAPLLIGCLLAVLMHGRLERRARPAGAAVAVAAIVASVLPGFAFVVLIAPVAVAVASAVAIHASAQGSGVSWLQTPWLTLVGRRSYALYLWHWPAIVLVNHALGNPGWMVLALTAVPLSWLLAVVSWRYVEEPFLRRSVVATQPAEAVLLRGRGPDAPHAGVVAAEVLPQRC